eukprot:SAG31_NODE_106_length_24954_cov_17.726413_10_plen_96_part_00
MDCPAQCGPCSATVEFIIQLSHVEVELLTHVAKWVVLLLLTFGLDLFPTVELTPLFWITKDLICFRNLLKLRLRERAEASTHNSQRRMATVQRKQ